MWEYIFVVKRLINLPIYDIMGLNDNERGDFMPVPLDKKSRKMRLMEEFNEEFEVVDEELGVRNMQDVVDLVKQTRHERRETRSKVVPDKITSVEDLFGTLPSNVDLDDARTERLECTPKADIDDVITGDASQGQCHYTK